MWIDMHIMMVRLVLVPKSDIFAKKAKNYDFWPKMLRSAQINFAFVKL